MEPSQQELIKIADQNIKNRYFSGFDYFYAKSNDKWTVINEDKIANLTGFIVLKDFDLQTYVTALYDYTSLLDKELAMDWYKGFTRNIFLFGNPEKLEVKFSNLLLLSTTDYAFVKPKRDAECKSLRMLLRSVTTNGKYVSVDHTVCIGSKPNSKKYRVVINNSNLVLERYLVHLTHTLLEAFILGIIVGDCTIEVVHTTIENVSKNVVYSRVDIDESDNSKLKLYSVLEVIE